MVEFNERTEFFIKDTMDDCIAEIQLRCKRYQNEQLRCKRYQNEQDLTRLDLDLIEREIMARMAYASVKGR